MSSGVYLYVFIVGDCARLPHGPAFTPSLPQWSLYAKLEAKANPT